MDASVVPAEVETRAGPVGLSARRHCSRLTAGSRSRSTGPTSGSSCTRWTRTCATTPLVARVARLRGMRHDHLARLLDASELTPGRIGLLVEHVDGLSLAQIRAARAPLSDGEAATVAIPVAGALGALHDAGLVHGGRTPRRSCCGPTAGRC